MKVDYSEYSVASVTINKIYYSDINGIASVNHWGVGYITKMMDINHVLICDNKPLFLADNKTKVFICFKTAELLIKTELEKSETIMVNKKIEGYIPDITTNKGFYEIKLVVYNIKNNKFIFPSMNAKIIKGESFKTSRTNKQLTNVLNSINIKPFKLIFCCVVTDGQNEEFTIDEREENFINVTKKFLVEVYYFIYVNGYIKFRNKIKYTQL